MKQNCRTEHIIHFSFTNVSHEGGEFVDTDGLLTVPRFSPRQWPSVEVASVAQSVHV